MDGNFSAEHMRCRSGMSDILLSPGMSFMANNELFRKHMQSVKEKPQVRESCLHIDTKLICA